MYCSHFKFSEKPFDVTPDPRFLYLTEGHRETLASIIYGIRERRGFIAITGEVGTGKTTLLNAALNRLDEKTKVAYIFNTDVTFDQMLVMALYEWGLVKPKENLSKVKAIQCLNNFAIDQMANGGNVVLIVDEAQNLDNRTMENLRLLSNLETQRHKLIQIVLSGQPELDTKLGRYELRQLAQRINLRRYVFPLDEKDTYAYLQHRLQLVKHKNASPFTDAARKLIWEYSGGVPRKINILCDNAFLIGYGLKKDKINGAIIQEAVRDLKWHRFSDTHATVDVPPAETTGVTRAEARPSRRHLKLTAVLIIAGILIFAGSFFLNEKGFQFAKLTGFISNAKETAPGTVTPDPKKQKEPLSLPVTPLQADIVQKIDIRKPPPKDIEPEPRLKSDAVSSLTVDRTPLLNEEKADLTDPAKQGEIIRQIVVKKGDTLYHILSQTYGTYDNVLLNEVLRQNPKIVDPGSIYTGQTIKLPEVGGRRAEGGGRRADDR